jgi:hypothetical protein
MTAINELNIPLHNDDAEYFLDQTNFDGPNRAIIMGGCNRNGNAIDITLYRDDENSKWKLHSAQIKRKTGKYSVSFVDMGSSQEKRLRTQLEEIGIL